MSELDMSTNAARAACAQFDADLPAFLEGEDRPFVARHAAECEFCAVVLGDLELIRSESQDFPLVEPPARLWTNIRASLEAEGIILEQKQGLMGWLDWFGHAGGIRFALQFGTAACLLLIGLILLLPTGVRKMHPVTAGVEPASPAPLGSANAAVNAGLVKSVSDMEASYREYAKSLDPMVQQSFQRGLQSLDDSIRECQNVVDQYPNDAEAREYLTSAYQQKAAVLMTALEYNGR